MAAAVANSAFETPVSTEIEAFDLPVEGALPPELCGDYIRNGPNARPGAKPGHLFLGDGMLHGLRLENGRARGYRNRWVRTRQFVENAPYVRKNGTLDLTVSCANTNVVAHGDRLLALVESSLPTEVTRDLATVGMYDFAGQLNAPFAAHPKRDPRTGELHGFGMLLRPGSLSYHRIDAAGTLVESRNVPVRGATMMHDFALTERYAIFMDLPVVFDTLLALLGKLPFRWSDRHGARLGIVDRTDPSAAVRWLAIEPCYVFHVVNAHEAGERIVMDVVRYKELWRNGNDAIGPANLHRFTIDLAAGRVSETPLDDRSIEFPRIDERRTASANRYAYTAALDTPERGCYAIRKYDLAHETSTDHAFPRGRYPGEATFVPAAAGEDAGWLMSFVYDAARDRSDFVVLDATNITAPAVAVVPLPVRIPLGLHGNWIPSHPERAP
jgi:carotenoid cleavage dioxygenase